MDKDTLRTVAYELFDEFFNTISSTDTDTFAFVPVLEAFLNLRNPPTTFPAADRFSVSVFLYKNR